jgi:hypothetical protein
VVSSTYCVVFLFCFLRLVYPMLPISLDCPFLIALRLVYPMLPISLDCPFLIALRLVYPMLPNSLDCPFLIAPSVLSNVYLHRDNQQYLNFNLFTRSN